MVGQKSALVTCHAFTLAATGRPQAFVSLKKPLHCDPSPVFILCPPTLRSSLAKKPTTLARIALTKPPSATQTRRPRTILLPLALQGSLIHSQRISLLPTTLVCAVSRVRERWRARWHAASDTHPPAEATTAQQSGVTGALGARLAARLALLGADGHVVLVTGACPMIGRECDPLFLGTPHQHAARQRKPI